MTLSTKTRKTIITVTIYICRQRFSNDRVCCSLRSVLSDIVKPASPRLCSFQETYLLGNPNTNNPSEWGKLTSGAATTDGKAFGEQASSPPAVDLTPDRPGRAGVGNINPILTGDPDSSKHPSELGQSLCTAFPGTFPLSLGTFPFF